MGVLGGAFNPPHAGHLVLARAAAEQLGLARVLLVPAGQAPHKRIEPEPGAEVRLEMTRLAAAEDDRLEVSAIEVEREGPSYTYRTLELLREEGPGAELVFLMGADVAAGLGSWRRPERVVELARLGVAARPGGSLPEAEAAIERLGAGGRFEVVEMPEVEISSSSVRERVASGESIGGMVPPAVEGLIYSRGLYGS